MLELYCKLDESELLRQLDDQGPYFALKFIPKWVKKLENEDFREELIEVLQELGE